MKFNNSYASLDPRLYHKQPPTPLTAAKAGHFNPIVAQDIGWSDDPQLMSNWVDIVSGSHVPDGFEPLAMAYAGHQFGQWAGQLGDGRGLLMAQVMNQSGTLTDLHLKGVGLTPYSRMGDGRAVLRSTIREYLCGHAMCSLGIPSSNALGFVSSSTQVHREVMERGAALMRVADSHIRLGHTEWIASFAPDLLASFTDYMIDTYYPSLKTSDTYVLDFISAVVQRTAMMIANWQLVGFAHGVMNTDNLSITGSTIDYGPFGFQERFDPTWINNHSDYAGRYTYQNQPAIGYWNLSVWAMNFLRLPHVTRDGINACLAEYESTFMSHYQQGITKKLGIEWSNDDTSLAIANTEHNNTTLRLAFEFLDIIEKNRLDYTNSFRALIAMVEPNQQSENAQSNHAQTNHEQKLLNQLLADLNDSQRQRLTQWQVNYLAHIDTLVQSGVVADKMQVINTLKACNPVYVLRNGMAQRAIDFAQQDDFSEVDRLFSLLTTPYHVQDIATDADISPPAKDAKPIVVSCSS